MSLSRAAAIGGGMALAGRPVATMLHAAAHLPRVSLREMTSETFTPHVGTAFDLVDADGRAVRAVLDRVTTAPRHGRDKAFRDPFSVTFSAPAGSAEVEAIVDIQHELLGRFALFVRPYRQGTACAYEAVFS